MSVVNKIKKRSITKKIQKKEKKDRFSLILFSRKESQKSYRTPNELYEALKKEFHFTAQPSGNKALKARQWGKVVYVNTPFKDPTAWVEKGLLEIKKHHTQTAVYLLKGDISTALFHDLVLPQAGEIRAVRGRLSFSGKGNSPFGSIIAVFRGSGRKKVSRSTKKKADREEKQFVKEIVEDALDNEGR